MSRVARDARYYVKQLVESDPRAVFYMYLTSIAPQRQSTCHLSRQMYSLDRRLKEIRT